MSKVLVLFVHGLAGGQETWGNFKDYLEKDEDIGGNIEVDYFNYKSKVARLIFLWKSVPIQDLAKGLETYIKVKHSDKKTIVLVCHSLGGIIAKRYINSSFKEGNPPSVREVIFFATPHLGAGIANIGARLSIGHHHLRQLGWYSDMIEMIAEDWRNLKCEAQIAATYVIGGQDAVVSRLSGAGLPGAHPEVIPDKGHTDIVKPLSNSDIAFLIVKQACLRATTDWAADLISLRSAIATRDENRVEALVVNKGRSWIETADLDQALDLLHSVRSTFQRNSLSVVFSEYLVAIARLFKDRSTSNADFDEDFARRAEPLGLRTIALAERMEFARKRRELDDAVSMGSSLKIELEKNRPIITPINAYAIGVAYFLLGNLFRLGGRYDIAIDVVERARLVFRPPILSHQVELAHCQYAVTICRLMTGVIEAQDVLPRPLGPQFRRFADALDTLTRSHTAWLSGDLASAVERADSAALVFQQIGFADYAKRAVSLSLLLKAWRALELGAGVHALEGNSGEVEYVRAMLGDASAISAFKAWLPDARPSRVLGMLQFASAYNADWEKDIGTLRLPPILKPVDNSFTWERAECTSFAEAHRQLRSSMGIAHDSRLPLIAD